MPKELYLDKLEEEKDRKMQEYSENVFEFTVSEIVTNKYKITLSNSDINKAKELGISPEEYIMDYMSLCEIFMKSKFIEQIDYVDTIRETLEIWK